MKNTKNTKLFFIAMLSLCALQRTFGMETSRSLALPKTFRVEIQASRPSTDTLKNAEVTAPSITVVTVAEPIATFFSTDKEKFQIPLFALSMPFRQGKPLSATLYNMHKDLGGEIEGTPYTLGNDPATIKSTALTQAFTIFADLYKAKINGANIDDEATYLQLLDGEGNALCNLLPIQDKCTQLLDLHVAGDYLESQALHDLCERQFLSPEIVRDFRINPQEYTNQWLLAARKIPVTAGTNIFLEHQTLHGHENAISADGNTIVSGSYDRTIKVCTRNPATQLFDQEPQTLRGHDDTVSSVAISTDNNTIISGSWDNTIKIWTINPTTQLFDQEPQTLRKHNDMVLSVAISADGNTIVSGSADRTIKVWTKDPTTQLFNQEPQTLHGHERPVNSVAISTDGKTIASGSRDHTIKVWTINPTTHQFNQEPQTLHGHDGLVYSVAISTDGSTIVSGSWDHTVKGYQHDYFNGTVSILQAMFIEAIKQAPRQILDLNKDTSANKALCTIARSLISTPAKDFVRAHVIMDWVPAAESAAAPADTKRCIIS